MAHFVPDFEPEFSSPTRGKKTAMGDEDIMELLWQNGQVVVQNQNQRSFKKSTVAGDAEIPAPQSSSQAGEILSVNAETLSRNQQHQHQQLFMQEAEMASWLHYPLDDYSLDREIYDDILYPSLSSAPITSPNPTTPPREIRSSVTEIRPPPPLPPPVPLAPSTSVAVRTPIAPPPRQSDGEVATSNFQNIINFSRVPRDRIESRPSSSSEPPMVESNETPALWHEYRVSLGAGSSEQPSCGNVRNFGASTSTAARDFATTFDLMAASSPGGSGASVEPPRPLDEPTLFTTEERKRKEREPDDADCHSDDVEFESAENKRQAHPSTSARRSRAAEIHNLSERRRRDRINEKMKALQELIPRCNKSDKASMLDEAIGYLKSLQLQVQMMSMGCGMVRMMYPGVQQYMPAMGAGMGMGIGMDMGMNQPMMPYPPHFPGSGFPIGAAGNLAPRFPMPAFQLQPVSVPGSARAQASNQPYPVLNSLIAQGLNQCPRMPGFVDPYQHFVHLHQAQVGVQNQVGVQPSTNKPNGSNRDAGHPEHHKNGK